MNTQSNRPDPQEGGTVAATEGRPCVSVAFGDGIGPEIMDAALRVMQAAGADFDIEPIEIGRDVYLSGNTSGITAEAWESLRRTRVFFKAPITTPQGGGYKSLNVTIRKSLGLFANVRPCIAYPPFVATRHPDMDLVVIRENEEDLYAGIEHRQTDDVYQCLKLITRPGSEKVIRYAFEYARAYGRKKVTCFSKDNIMKMTDGLFHEVFREVAKEYPEIGNEHLIVDIGAALLADQPERFDVLVMPNLYGDIISDIAAQLSGSVGLGASANIGERCAMFEAIHGSAPDLAGRGIANPSGLLLAGVMMLVHLGRPQVAETIHNAWLRTISDGIHTADIYRDRTFTRRVSTEEFADAVIERLGQRPTGLTPVSYADAPRVQLAARTPERAPARKTLVGVDVFVHHRGAVETLAERVKLAEAANCELKIITNRGVKVWPGGFPETFCTDHWRCRFVAPPDGAIERSMVVELLQRLCAASVDFIKTEHLYEFDGKPGYSLGQGQ